MLEKVQEFYDIEIYTLKNLIKYGKCKKNYFESSITQGLGVAQFVQTCGVSFEEIDTLYEDFKTKVKELEKEWLTNNK